MKDPKWLPGWMKRNRGWTDPELQKMIDKAKQQNKLVSVKNGKMVLEGR